MRIAESVADFIVGLQLSDVPKDVIDEAKWCLIDWSGVTVAGSRDPSVEVAWKSLTLSDSGGPATIVGRRRKAGWLDAAYLNGLAGHVLNFDDMSPVFIGHNTSLCAPVALGAGEMVGATGAETLLAFIAGWETACALGYGTIPIHYQKGWHSSGTVGVFGCAAVASKLLRLSKTEVIHALGIAASVGAGLRSNFGTLTNVGHIGHAVEQGLHAAIQAMNGWTSSPKALEGFFDTLALGHRPDVGLKQLGRTWAMLDPGVSRKLVPSCGAMHPAIEGMLQLVESYDLQPDDIEHVHCSTTPAVAGLLSFPIPASTIEARYSLPLGLAAAIKNRRVDLSAFEEKAIRDPEIVRLMKTVTWEVDSKLSGPDMSANFTTVLEVSTRTGRTLNKRVDAPRGPMTRVCTREDLRLKFEYCAKQVLQPAQASGLLHAITNMHRAANLQGLLANLVPTHS